MGQYYKYLVIDKDNTPHTASSWGYDNGAKLMEHSYIGNPFVNACLDSIYYNPCQVAWVGDYSKDGACVYNDKAEGFNKFYEMCWDKYNEETEQFYENAIAEDDPVEAEDIISFNMKDCKYFLINHTKKIFLDIAKFVEGSKWHEEGDWYDREAGEDKHYSYDMCINPLPLLTACGNNQGGGDFYENHTGFENVGIWALDTLELTEDKPFGYEEVEYCFKEE